jgi:hypothetical protein
MWHRGGAGKARFWTLRGILCGINILEMIFCYIKHDVPSTVRQTPPPPISIIEFDQGRSQGPFFFWFQRGLAMATGL